MIQGEVSKVKNNNDTCGNKILKVKVETYLVATAISTFIKWRNEKSLPVKCTSSSSLIKISVIIKLFL